MEEISTILNSSLLRMRETSTVSTFVAVRNTSVVASKVASNAYEWRFILPPYILIFMLSISGNCLVIATLASNRRMRTVTNVYLLNLAISDFLLGVFCLPFTLVGQIYRRFLFGALLCKLIPFLQAVSVSVDVWTLVAISLERYFAICRPLKSRKWQTQCHAYKMIAMVWILSIMLNSPILIVSDLQPMRGNAFKCREVWTSLELERAFNLGIDAGLLLIPIFIMSFAYSLIVTKLWRGMRHEIQHNFKWQRHLTSCKSNHLIPTTPIIKSNSADICCKKWYTKKLQKDESEQRLDVDNTSAQSYCMHTVDMEFRHVVRSTHIDKSIEAKRKVIRMLFVIIMEFFVCWTPLHVINTIYLFYPDELYQYIGSKGVVLLQLLAYCSSCCNPITYCFMNRKFKQAFISLIKSFRIFGACFSEKSECKQATPPPASSSQDATACVIRGSHTGRTGDSGFALRPYMMVPCSNPEPGSREECYNDLHATARNTAERTIGVLKGRFRCLLVHRVLHYDPEMVGKIIKACCVLHNICNQARVPPVELPTHLQRQEASVIRLLQQGSQNSISDIDSGRLARGRLINRLWRGQNS